MFTEARGAVSPRLMAGFLIIQYVSATLILFLPASKYADLEYLSTMPRTYITFFFADVIWHLGGQTFLWILVLEKCTSCQASLIGRVTGKTLCQ